jgi:ubiquitin C-terminal hydrolase
MQSEEETKPIHGLAGLLNVGNTCYANAVLQTLRVIPSLTLLVDKHRVNPEDGTPQKIFTAYQDVARTLWSPESLAGAVCRPMAFWKEVRESVIDTVYESFNERIPHDSHEFLCYILDQCHEALKEETTERHLYPDGYRSPVTDLIFGWDKITVSCPCGHQNTRFEPFNMLKVPISDSTETSLVQQLIDDRKDEDLEGYTCDGCKQKEGIKLQRRLWKLPPTLFYVVKRFRPDGRKDTAHLGYDGAPVDFTTAFAKDSPNITSSPYKAIGTIDHMGSHMGGHYVAQVYHPLLKKWVVFDDEVSHVIDAGPALSRSPALSGPHIGRQTYIIALTTDYNCE